jgi:hypothetical protein
MTTTTTSTQYKVGDIVIIDEEMIDSSKDVVFFEKLLDKKLMIVEITDEYNHPQVPTYKCIDLETREIIKSEIMPDKHFPFVDSDLKIKRDMDRVLLNMILGHPVDVEFLLQKLKFVEKLTKEYDSIGFTERLEHIVDNAEEMLVNNLLYGTYKHIGELVINYKFNLDDLYEEMGISNHDVIQKYNCPAPNGNHTVYDSILSEFDFENITDSDIEKFKAQVLKDFTASKQEETEDIAKEDVIKNDIMHNIFCLDEEYGIVVPTFKELVAAGEILPEWQLSEEYEHYPYDSIVNIINEKYSDFLETLYALDSFNENEKKKKKYGYRTYVEYGTPLEIIEVLQELHDWNDDVEDKDKFILLQASVKKEDFSTIQVLLGIEIGYAKLEAYLKDELDVEFHDEVAKLIEAIKEAKADNHDTLHLYDC